MKARLLASMDRMREGQCSTAVCPRQREAGSAWRCERAEIEGSCARRGFAKPSRFRTDSFMVAAGWGSGAPPISKLLAIGAWYWMGRVADGAAFWWRGRLRRGGARAGSSAFGPPLPRFASVPLRMRHAMGRRAKAGRGRRRSRCRPRCRRLCTARWRSRTARSARRRRTRRTTPVDGRASRPTARPPSACRR